MPGETGALTVVPIEKLFLARFVCVFSSRCHFRLCYDCLCVSCDDEGDGTAV